ncbi:MAG: aldo/keto reductase [Kiritimatiellia bacterium]|jgi:predicted aldo/keto reductase-like oxidoreductase
MNRREFIKGALAVAALAPVTRLSAVADDAADAPADAPAAPGSAEKVTRRPFRDTGITLPLLGFGMMRLPRVNPGSKAPDIDYATTQKMFDRAMAAGVNYFDTAYFYHGGLSEKCAGDLLARYPRDSYFLADKMPIGIPKTEEDVARIFEEQLDRTKAGHFDFYLVHGINGPKWEEAKKLRVYEFMEKMRDAGKIRFLGFSFHGSPEELQKIVDERPWDFVQIQLNYIDWEAQRAREQYGILTKADIPVVVMEPIRGGALAGLNPQAVQTLKSANPDASPASWALRYVGSLPNVVVILSGMSLPEHVEDNIRTFSPFQPLTDAERRTLALAAGAYQGKLAIPCTGCRYCMPCGAGVDIPAIFALANEAKLTGDADAFRKAYAELPEEARASECVRCHGCERKCPQQIAIVDELAKIAKEVEP